MGKISKTEYNRCLASISLKPGGRRFDGKPVLLTA